MPRAAALAFLAAAALGIPSCAPARQSYPAEVDQEVTRNILWRFRQEPGDRFKDVRVSCVDREVVLEGRVGDVRAAEDARSIAVSLARGAPVVSRLDIRPR